MRLRWFAVSLLALVAAAVVGVLIFAGRLVDANRDRIQSSFETAIGRPVHIGSIGVRLIGRPGVTLTDVSVAEDPAFGNQPFLAAQEAAVLLKVRPLFHGRLEIGRIELDQPLVRIVRNADGRFNYQTLGVPERQAQTSGATSAPPADGGFGWAVALFDIEDGAVEFLDNGVSPPKTTEIRKISLRASDIALDEAIQFKLSAAADAPTENVALSGSFGPVQSADGVPFEVQGNFGPFERLPLRVESLDASGKARPAGIEIAAASVTAFGGEFTAHGTLPLVAAGPFSFIGKGSDIELQKLLPVVAPKAKQEIEGVASIDVALNGVGNTEASLRASMRGQVTVWIRDGVLRHFNLPSEVVNRIPSLPGLSQLLSDNVKPKYAAVLNRPDTQFESLEARLDVAPGVTQVETFKLVGDDFGAEATGTIRPVLQADLRGEVSLSRRFSADVAADVKEARLLYNADDEIAVPFIFRGEIGRARPQPDVERLTSSILSARGSDILKEVGKGLNKLFRR